jgi:hypothetical protein
MISTTRLDGNLPTRPHGDMSSAKRKFESQTTNLLVTKMTKDELETENISVTTVQGYRPRLMV